MKKVLLVEDDLGVYELLKYTIERAGFHFVGANSGRDAIDLCVKEKPHLILLDISLPEVSGYEICSRARNHPALAGIPIIFITGRACETDRIIGLELGARDYIAKPFSIAEVISRIRVHLRAPSPLAHLRGGSVELDRARCQVLRNGIPVHLTATEFRLLEFLMRQPGVVFGREQLLNEVWGPGRCTLDRTVDVYMLRLRKKIEADPTNPSLVHCVRGFGYSFDPRDRLVAVNHVAAPDPPPRSNQQGAG